MQDSKMMNFTIVAPTDAAYIQIVHRLTKRKITAAWNNTDLIIHAEGPKGLIESICKRFGAECKEVGEAVELEEPGVVLENGEVIPPGPIVEEDIDPPTLPAFDEDLIKEKDQDLMSDDDMQRVGTTCHSIPYDEISWGLGEHEHTTGVDPFFLTGE
jgi:hypothetical protein